MKWKGDITGGKWGGGCLDKLSVVAVGRSSALSFQSNMGGKEWENQWHLKMSRDWKCVYRGCQITGAGNNTYVWLDKHVWACMHVVCPFACSRLYKTFFFSSLLRQNKSWEINTSLPWACLCRTAGVELVDEEEVTSDRQFVFARSCTPMPGATSHAVGPYVCVKTNCMSVRLMQILLLRKILGSKPKCVELNSIQLFSVWDRENEFSFKNFSIGSFRFSYPYY